MGKAKKTTEPINKRTEPITFRFDPILLKKVSYIAFKDEIYKNDIAEMAIEDYISKWEKKNGEIKF